jgi:hypothetical protein
MTKEMLAERAKFSDADDRWALFTRAQKIVYDGMRPHLRRKTTTADGAVRAHVNMAAIGGNLDAIRRAASDGTLAGIMNCREVSVREDLTKPGRAWLTFWKVSPLDRPISLDALPVSGPERVSFGIDQDGEPAAIDYGLSVLIVGETKSGKSKCAWDMFADILRDGKPTEVTILDPKGTELAVFKPLVGKKVGNILIKDYKRSADDAVNVFATFVAEMKARQDRLAGVVRQVIEPTEDMPARYVWVDEMNELQKAFAKVDSPMVTAISQGRSSLDWVVASVQVAKVSVLGEVRDQFPTNVCFRTKTKANTIAALATDADSTPPCHLIPRSTPGVGYYVDVDGETRKFRTAHVTDKQLDDLAHGKLPEGMVMRAEEKYQGPPCFVYDAPLKGSNRRGYVGIAGADGTQHPVATRRKKHRKYDRVWCAEHDQVENWWVKHIDDRRMNVTKCPSRAAARMLEERLIRDPRSVPEGAKFTGRPVWNVQHNTDNPDSNIAMTRRAGMQTRARDAMREWTQFTRESWALHQVKAGWRKNERVEKVRARRDQFEQRVLEGSYR